MTSRPLFAFVSILSAFFALGVPTALGEKVYRVEGGLSPDESLAVVVLGNRDWHDVESLTAPQSERQAYLYDQRHDAVIGPLEEILADGGGFGFTRKNVVAQWNSSGDHVEVTFRDGRASHGLVVYRIEPYGQASRAQLEPLPVLRDGPNSGAIFDQTTTTPHAEERFRHWLNPSSFTTIFHGLRAREPKQILSRLVNENGDVEVVYVYDFNHQWHITGYQRP